MFCHPVLHWFVAIRTLLNVSFGRSAGLVIAGLPYPFLRVIPSQAKAGTDAERSQSTTITLCEVVLKRKTKQLSCSQTPWQNVHKASSQRHFKGPRGPPVYTAPSYEERDLFIYFILRLGAHGLWPKDEKESKKGETVTAAKETRKHTNKQAKLLPSLSPRLTAPPHYRLLSRQI
jgi:hypothetical protein